MSSMKTAVFWDAVSFSLVDTDGCFREAYCLHYKVLNLITKLLFFHQGNVSCTISGHKPLQMFPFAHNFYDFT
jgi:ATP adenylyltransferase/5',5'''-P-1,P-4-tetraphosphate phosphorylase II